MSEQIVNATSHPSYTAPPPQADCRPARGAEPACRPARGPKTEEGKLRSSRNAVTHGLTAQRTVVADEDRDEYEDLIERLRDQVGPENSLQDVSFLHLVHHAWCLLRCQRIEEEIFAASPNPFADEGAARQLERLTRYQTMHRNAYYRALKELRELQTNSAARQAVPRSMAESLPPLADVRRAGSAKRNPLDPYGVDLQNLERLLWAGQREAPDEFDDDEEAASAAM